MNVTLRSGNYEITINTMGAELKSFRTLDGKEFFWNSNPEFWMRSSPLLFPTIGNVRNGETYFDHVKYEMAKHGFCKDSEFIITAQTDTSATFTLKASEATKSSYPYEFELSLTYELVENNLKMTYMVSNRDKKDMPYHIGAHPGFMCPLEEDEKLTDYQLVFEKEETFSAIPYDLEQMCFASAKRITHGEKGTILPLSVEMFDNDAVFFPHSNSHAVKLVHAAKGHGVSVSYPDFHSIAFWTPAGGNAPFVCIEPWNGAAIYDDEDDNFIHKRDIELLAPAQSKTYHLEITLLDK